MIGRLLHWLWQVSAGIRGKLTLNACCGLCYIVASLTFVYVSKEAIDYVTHGEGVARQAVYLYGLALMSIFLIELGLNLLINWMESQTEVTMKSQLRYRLFRHLTLVTWEDWEKYHSGDVLNRLEEDVRVISECICRSVPQLLVTSVQVVAAFIFLYYLNPMLAWSIIIIMPFFLLASKLFFYKLRKLTRNIRDTDSEVQVVMQESLQHHSYFCLNRPNTGTGGVANRKE